LHEEIRDHCVILFQREQDRPHPWVRGGDCREQRAVLGSVVVIQGGTESMAMQPQIPRDHVLGDAVRQCGSGHMESLAEAAMYLP
jgi:hypothetical protein